MLLPTRTGVLTLPAHIDPLQVTVQENPRAGAEAVTADQLAGEEVPAGAVDRVAGTDPAEEVGALPGGNCIKGDGRIPGGVVLLADNASRGLPMRMQQTVKLRRG